MVRKAHLTLLYVLVLGLLSYFRMVTLAWGVKIYSASLFYLAQFKIPMKLEICDTLVFGSEENYGSTGKYLLRDNYR